MRIVNVPGYTGSGPDHWQSWWQRGDPRFTRIDGVDWDRPTRTAWVDAIQRELERGTPPVFLIAHSLGCAGVVHWAGARAASRVLGALLAAPADPEVEELRGIADDFAPIPLEPLPFPSRVVLSTNDPYVTTERGRLFADAWGSDLVEIGEAGHVNTAAGFGRWPEGRRMVEEWLSELATVQR